MLNMRDRQLDGLRAAAVSMVLYAHLFAADDSHLGHLGVRLFFVLSGFLITRLLLDARSAAQFEPAMALKSFYARRAVRIFPPYFGMLSVLWLVNLEGARDGWVWHALYISNFWYALRDAWTPWVLCHTWSLSIEEQFYIAWPLLVVLTPRPLLGRVCVGVIASSLAYRFYWPLTGEPSLARDLLPPASMDALAAGALLAVHRSTFMSWPRWMMVSWLPLSILSSALLWARSTSTGPVLDWLVWIGLEAFPLIPVAMLVGCASTGFGGRVGRLLELKPLTALGCVSYGVYLYHPVVLALVVKAQAWIPIDIAEQGLRRLLVAGSATLIVAAVSWFAFEKPLNALKRHFPYVRANSSSGVVPMNTGQATDCLRGRTVAAYLPGVVAPCARGKTLSNVRSAISRDCP
ncbi:acyltransferase (plasmid) [Ensifer adhaerens]|uniref:acyltransferase family protein n=1 Tax=Ensifer adhaerens TaxID=106592 RepID=UPI0023A969B8|nr:acyltransferase [Ensifer adhaerens]WDZ81670.1 acyltransferase [Ensifer adhaerens]